MPYSWTTLHLSVLYIGVEIPNRISTDQTDVKKPVRYCKKKGKQLQEKNELGDAEQEKIGK